MTTSATLECEPSSRTRRASASALWAGLAVSVLTVPLAALTVLATPHVRGLGFFIELRYAITTLTCALLSLAAAFCCEAFGRRRFRRALLGVVLVTLAGLSLGRSGLLAAAAPAVLLVALLLSYLSPRSLAASRSRSRRAAILLFALLEGMLAIWAWRSEQLAPAGDDAKFSVPRALFDVEHRFVTLPSGARVHYVDEGQGPVLLFLHGNPAWSFQWRALIAGLRGSFRCIALDYPGFGMSSGPEGYGYTAREQSQVLEELVDALKLRDLTLVMQDWGGPIGLGFAGRRPELVGKLVLGSTWAWPTTSAEPRGKFSLVAGGPLGEFIQINFNGFAALGIEHGIVRKLPREQLATYLRPFVPLDRRGIAAFYPGQINAASDYFRDLAAGLPKLAKLPVLIFWAGLDEGFPRSDLTRWQHAFARHQTIELPNANHFFFEDESTRMLPRIAAFAR